MLRSIKLLALLLIFGTSANAATYTTNFNTTENPISEGGAWHHTPNVWTFVKTELGYAHGTNGVTGTYDDSYAFLAGFGPDQTVTATVYRDPNQPTGASHEVELLLRWSDDGSNARGYECDFDISSNAMPARWNGAFGDVVPLALTQSGYIGRQLVTGDVLKCSIVGNTITMYINDTLMAQAVDSAITTGQPGIGFFVRPGSSNSLLGYSDFTAVDAGPGTPVPSVALGAAPASIANGASSTLTWSSANVDSCTASGAWSGALATSGSLSTGALTSSHTYSIDCTGAYGPAHASVTVTVAPPPGAWVVKPISGNSRPAYESVLNVAGTAHVQGYKYGDVPTLTPCDAAKAFGNAPNEYHHVTNQSAVTLLSPTYAGRDIVAICSQQ